MIFVFLSICCSVLLGFAFKLFPRFGVDTFQAIVFNYITCVLCGWAYLGAFPVGPAPGDEARWLPYSLVLGIVFITGFTASGRTVREFGVTISQIMQKMTILVAVPFAIVVYGESSGWMKIVGFILALAAIILVNWPQQTAGPSVASKHRQLIWLPIVVWLLSSVIDVSFLSVQGEKMIVPGDVRFVTTIFGTAGVLGLLTAIVGWTTGRLSFHWRNIVGGIVLGIPNFGSLTFLLQALSSGMEGSLVFPIVNVGIILTTTFGAVLLFREKLSALNWIGIACAATAIALIAFG